MFTWLIKLFRNIFRGAEDKEITLHQAAEKGLLNVVKALLADGADVNAKDNNGKTALHWAAYEGHKEIVKDLLAAGADANAKDKDRETALHKAARNGHKDVILLLLVAGADPSFRILAIKKQKGWGLLEEK